MVTKSYGVQTQQFLQEKEQLGQTRFSVTICMNKSFLYTHATMLLMTALKIILIYVYGCEKKKKKKAQTHTHGLEWNQNWKSDFHKSW